MSMRFSKYDESSFGTPTVNVNIIKNESTKSTFIKHYSKNAAVDDIVVIPGDVICNLVTDDYSRGFYIEPRASLCLKNGYGSCVVISFHDSIAEAEAARLQFIHDYIDKKNKDFEL